jgi:hypothetical protein
VPFDYQGRRVISSHYNRPGRSPYLAIIMIGDGGAYLAVTVV